MNSLNRNRQGRVFFRQAAWGVVSLLIALGGLEARDREAARAAFESAVAFEQKLDSVPSSRRSLEQYRTAIFLYRTVVDHDPTYGAADDALYAVARLYDEMAERFQNAGYRQRARYYYEFVAREYPTTPHRRTALARAAEMSPPAPRPLEPEPGAGIKAEVTMESPVPESPISDTRKDLATVSEIRYWSSEDYTRVVIQLDREVTFQKEVLHQPDRIYFDLESASLNSELVGRNYEVNGLFIQRIRVAENRPNVVRVVLDFNEISKHTVFALYDPFRIVIDTQGERPPSALSSPGTEKTTKTAEAVIPLEAGADERKVIEETPVVPSPNRHGDRTLTRVLGLKVGRVVLDPGHGGKDTGTIGPAGLREKDLVLDVALRLRKLLETQLGTDVIMTREADVFVPLEERTAIANQKGADLFISIHANASRNRSVEGVETFVLNFATNPDEREVASRENATAQRNIRELEDLLKKIALGDYNVESRELAHIVQNQLHEGLSKLRPNGRNRGVKQAPFIVLIGSNMPSILTEIGFISNPSAETLFKTDSARDRVAESLFAGIEAYFRSLGSIASYRDTAAAP